MSRNRASCNHNDGVDIGEFATIAFSTFFGATVALIAERFSRARDARHREEAALNNLILDLAAKRAFLVSTDWTWADGEIDRVVSSVHHARTLIREARLQLRPRSKALPQLRQMGRACNSFLESSERESDEELKRALRNLTAALTVEVDALHSLNPSRILSDAPGSASLPETVREE
jgi:hypothetical protein